jgi:hypothetical protein
MPRCRRTRTCDRRRAAPTAPAPRPRHARRSAPAASPPPGTPGWSRDPTFSIGAGPRPGRIRGSASRTCRSGAWPPFGAAPTPRRTPRPRRRRRLRPRPSPARAAEPIALSIAPRSPLSSRTVEQPGNVRRERGAAADGLLRRPRIDHKSPKTAVLVRHLHSALERVGYGRSRVLGSYAARRCWSCGTHPSPQEVSAGASASPSRRRPD